MYVNKIDAVRTDHHFVLIRFGYYERYFYPILFKFRGKSHNSTGISAELAQLNIRDYNYI